MDLHNCHEDKTREDMIGRPGPNKGKTFSEETRRKMSESGKKRQGRKGHTKGRKYTDEQKKAHSEAMKRTYAATPRIMPPASEERKRKVSESMKLYHAQKWEAV